MLRRSILLLSAVALAAVALSAVRPAQAAYPERTITVVCASGAGGAVDVERFEQVGIVEPRATGPAFLAKYLSGEIEKWGDVLRTTKDTD